MAVSPPPYTTTLNPEDSRLAVVSLMEQRDGIEDLGRVAADVGTPAPLCAHGEGGSIEAFVSRWSPRDLRRCDCTRSLDPHGRDSIHLARG